MDRSFAEIRLISRLFFALSAIGLLLAAIGLFGVISQLAAQRRLEMGIRLALGARPAQILNLMLAQGLSVALTGIALGAAAGLGATRQLSGLLFEVSQTDPFAWASAVLSRSNPVEVLR